MSTGRMLIDNSVLWLGMPSIQYQSMPDHGRGQYVQLFGADPPPDVIDPEYPGPTNGAQKLMTGLAGVYCSLNGASLGTFDSILPYLGWKNMNLTQAGTPFYVGFAFFISAATWDECTPSGSCTTDAAIMELYFPDLLMRIRDADRTILYFDIPAARGILNDHVVVPDEWNYFLLCWSVEANSTFGTLQSWDLKPNAVTNSWLLNPQVTMINDYQGTLLSINGGNDSSWDVNVGIYQGDQLSVQRTVNIGQLNVGSELLHAYPQVALKTIVDQELFRFSSLTLASTPGALTPSGNVSYWNDSSGNGRGYAAVPGVHTTTLPVYNPTCMNGLPGVSFPLSSALSAPSVMPAGFSFTLMAVVSIAPSNLQQAFLGQDKSFVDSYGTSNGTAMYARSQLPYSIGAHFAIPPNTPTMLTFQIDYSYHSTTAFINGALAGTVNLSFVSLMDPTCQVGCSLNRFCFSPPSCIGEIVLFNLMLTPAQQQQEEQALRTKWGLS